MLKNYIKIALRGLRKNGLFSLLNLFGLSFGVVIFLYLFLFTKQELSFDKYHSNAANIYRIGQTVNFEGKEDWGSVPNIVGPKMTEAIPEIKSYTRSLHHSFGKIAFVNSERNKFSEKKLYWTDPGLFEIFDVPFVYGNPKTALDAPNKVILSKTIAEKYFGKENPMGKSLKVDNNYDLTVGGVYEDFPNNSTLEAELIGSFSTIKWASNKLHWSNASFETYFLLEPLVDIKKVEAKINAVLDENISKENQWFTFWLQPLSDIHLYSTQIAYTSSTRTGDKKQVNILIALALGILIIACINYMNLATAQSQKRKKEVGVSKAMGASQTSLIKRFYTEALIMVALAVFFGLILLVVGLPFLNSIAGQSISLSALIDAELIMGIILTTILLAIIAGSYPALLLSSFSTLSLFGRREESSISTSSVRKGLVIVQFSASIILMIGTFVFYSQLKFIQDRQLGYDTEHVVAVTTQGAENQNQINDLMASYKSLGFVGSVSRSQTYPGASGSGRTIVRYEEPDKIMGIQTNFTDPEILETLDIKLLSGQIFANKTSTQDTTVQVVVNKTTIDFLGYSPEEAIGQTAYNLFNWNKATIVGVMEDFHFQDFHKPIGAYAFHNNPSESKNNLLVRFNGGNLSDNLAALEAGFQKSIPSSAFEYQFLDDVVAKLYTAEKQLGRIVLFFSITAIFIACLGLFGLSAFTAEQRTKELGVRKVLGANIRNLVGLLSAEFMKLVIISLLISAPIAWYVLNGWLESYAFHINIPWWIFGMSGVLTILIAFLTVSFQSIKAALINPVESLKSE
ncbi:ABC transporter permease [uncultured Arcticibacterium sp.]|uniref:ABC transporter permease n=1 Tax=uncultured Arcticibacterium sp. TaxID=2173042 RepID=UPI0030F792D1